MFYKTFLNYLLISLSTSQILKKSTLVIGVVTIDVKKNLNLKKKTTYFFTSYAKWLEENNLEWIPISIYDGEKSLYKKLNKINGVFLTGGTQDLIDENGFDTNYKKVLLKIIEFSKMKFNRGIIFPVVGTCLGFESLLNILTENTIKLKNASNENESRKVHLTKKAYKSKLKLVFSNQDLDEFSKNLFYFHHSLGYEKTDIINNPYFRANLNALGFTINDQGRKILSIFEHKKYPFIAWQFHPEKIQFEHNDTFRINRSRESIYINSKFSGIFGELLKFETPKINYNEVFELRRGIYDRFLYDGNDESYFFTFFEFNQGNQE